MPSTSIRDSVVVETAEAAVHADGAVRIMAEAIEHSFLIDAGPAQYGVLAG